MKILTKTKENEFELFLQSIGGLKNGYFTDRPPIITNICECGDGWLPIIRECIEKLIVIGWNKEICQIKEKFGTLRFYTNGLPEEGWKIIEEATNKSSITCEYCGKSGQLRNKSWMQTLCDKCNENSK